MESVLRGALLSVRTGSEARSLVPTRQELIGRLEGALQVAASQRGKKAGEVVAVANPRPRAAQPRG